ncbi:MAG: DNA internalization-related competence protein ComEC/Rec2 [Lautropia sp.]|nr:DNA internalization-related competence protein ComEC/Rec2 [Lautropia sp.]
MIISGSLIPRLSWLAMLLLLLACMLHFSGWLPPVSWLPGMVLSGVLLYASRLLRLAGLSMLLACVLVMTVHHALQARLNPALQDVPLWIEGQVAALPQRQDFGDRIVFRVGRCWRDVAEAQDGDGNPSSMNGQIADCGALRHVSLTWSLLPGGSSSAVDDLPPVGLSGGEDASRSGEASDGRERGQPGPAQGAMRAAGRQEVAGIEAGKWEDGVLWPEPGQYWRLRVKLRLPLAPVNPYAFDTEQRLLQQQIDAVGRVLLAERLQADGQVTLGWLERGLAWVEAQRSWLRQRLEVVYVSRVDPSRGQHAAGWNLLGIVTGLSLGDQAAIGADAWALFSRTGVSHLMAISGMHVTLLAMVVSAGCVWLHRIVARRAGGMSLSWLERQSRQRLVLVPAVLTAFGYALLSGWGVPAQRTCFMLLAAAVLSAGGRSQNALFPVVLAGAAVAALDPWAVAQAGFWLSFGAVLALIWCAQQPLVDTASVLGAWGLWRSLREAVRNQWAATIFLMPMTVAFFSTWSLSGPLANALAIPWVSFVLTPMAIAVMLLAPLSEWLAGHLLSLLLWQLDGLMSVLRWLDAWPHASVSLPRPGAWTLACALLGAALILAPAGLRRVRLGVLCLLPMLLAPARSAPADALVITALDIGQSSMVLVEQGDRRLLYDAGSARGGGRSAVERVLLPYLQARGLKHVDTLVISHLDAHHSGGSRVAWERLQPSMLISSVAPPLLGVEWPSVVPRAERAVGEQRSNPGVTVATESTSATPEPLTSTQVSGRHIETPVPHRSAQSTGGDFLACIGGQSLSWGSAMIDILHPAQLAQDRRLAADDRQSCVIRIHSAAGSVLLAGDLPVTAEQGLIRQRGAHALKADVLVLPRQGSRHGAGDALLAAVAPQWVVLQTSYRNHHGHPHPQLMQRLARHETQLLRTDLEGAVRIELRAGQSARIERSRLDGAPYWRLRPVREADPGG